MNHLPIVSRPHHGIVADAIEQVYVLHQDKKSLKWLVNVKGHLLFFIGSNKISHLSEDLKCEECNSVILPINHILLSTYSKYSVTCLSAPVSILAVTKAAALAYSTDQQLIFVDLQEIQSLLQTSPRPVGRLHQSLVRQPGISCAAISPSFDLKISRDRPIIWGQTNGSVYVYQFKTEQGKENNILLCKEENAIIGIAYVNEYLVWSTAEGSKIFHFSRQQKVAFVTHENRESVYSALWFFWDLKTIGLCTSNMEMKIVQISASEDRYTAKITSSIGVCCPTSNEGFIIERILQIVYLPEDWHHALQRLYPKWWNLIRKSECSKCYKAYKSDRTDVIALCLAKMRSQEFVLVLSSTGFVLQYYAIPTHTTGTWIVHTLPGESGESLVFVTDSELVLFNLNLSVQEFWTSRGIPVSAHSQYASDAISNFISESKKKPYWSLVDVFNLVAALEVILAWVTDKDVTQYLEPLIRMFDKKVASCPRDLLEALRDLLATIFSSLIPLHQKLQLYKIFLQNINSCKELTFATVYFNVIWHSMLTVLGWNIPWIVLQGFVNDLRTLYDLFLQHERFIEANLLVLERNMSDMVPVNWNVLFHTAFENGTPNPALMILLVFDRNSSLVTFSAHLQSLPFESRDASLDTCCEGIARLCQQSRHITHSLADCKHLLRFFEQTTDVILELRDIYNSTRNQTSYIHELLQKLRLMEGLNEKTRFLIDRKTYMNYHLGQRLEVLGTVYFTDLVMNALTFDPHWIVRDMIGTKSTPIKSDLRMLKGGPHLAKPFLDTLLQRLSNQTTDPVTIAVALIGYFLGGSRWLVRMSQAFTDASKQSQLMAIAALLVTIDDDLVYTVSQGNGDIASTWLYLMNEIGVCTSTLFTYLCGLKAAEEDTSADRIWQTFMRRLCSTHGIVRCAEPAMFAVRSLLSRQICNSDCESSFMSRFYFIAIPRGTRRGRLPNFRRKQTFSVADIPSGNAHTAPSSHGLFTSTQLS
eukprot:Gregarina_sp_Poly_1__1807@NODE_146_length_12814_cov_124_771633_g131_i0_p1_GENE_NODE_146_length_12814_cov_124_771633_g131_i0NODE_146_length_12814_cov_124_771633_g131_i0_p1_ORF_typecomplete_len985_score89_56DUF3455/PF11937_8/1_4DUF3455/PF11937_8/1e03_NODE_146_length_12814_cov_124_771633_g131_i017394693